MEKFVEKMKELFTYWCMIIVNMIKNKKNVSNIVTISGGNNKMGKVASVSLLPILTCPKRCKETCGKKCYAKKLCALRPTVANSYAKNTAIAIHSTKAYFKAINKAVQNIRYFRYHVSGDIPNKEYFRHMIKTAIDNENVSFLCFTKQYEIVNEWIKENGKIPGNLHILFSEWTNLKAINPYNLPTTNVYEKEEEIKDNWKLCGGNCLNCACRGVGCWQANNGETIAFKIH